MVNHRLEFALTQLEPSDWREFEKFASEFLVEDFPTLREMASSSGDGGRDAELFSISGAARTKFQYSVAADPVKKVSDTLTKIAKNFPDTRRLIYCTNQEVGAKLDDVVEKAWNNHGITVDLRDKNWFVGRRSDSAVRSSAAERLIDVVAQPALRRAGLIDRVETPLSADDGKVAFLQLALSESDQKADQSLTKTSFDALVLSVLVDTSAEATLTQNQISSAVAAILPAADRSQVIALACSALTRLSRRRGPVKRISSSDSYHLSHDASTEWQEGAAEFILEQEELERDISAALYGVNDRLDNDLELLNKEARTIRVALERLLLERGEAFARSISDEVVLEVSTTEITSVLGSFDLDLTVRATEAASAILTVLGAPSDRSRAYLERTLNAYTMLAFLHQTPDVQKALSRLFDGAEIWLDTSAILPLIGEMALSNDEVKPFTRLFQAAVESGIKLYVTHGVIEEISHHLDNCLRYVLHGADWRSRVPYVFSAYVYSGRSVDSLSAWVADIKGTYRPEQDIEEYLSHWFSIERLDLSDLAETADLELRGAVQTLWIDSHSRRRQGAETAINVVDRLVSNDVENVVGVIEKRKRTKSSPLGFSAWWLTLDSTASRLPAWLIDQLGPAAPPSPAISPDYLSQVLRFGPLRRRPSSEVPVLPVSVEIRRFENVPVELISIARDTREQYSKYGELRIRREVRDALDRARTAGADSSMRIAAIDDEVADADVEVEKAD